MIWGKSLRLLKNKEEVVHIIFSSLLLKIHYNLFAQILKYTDGRAQSFWQKTDYNFNASKLGIDL
jgi:hypothetical protein